MAAKSFSILQPDYFESRNKNYLLIWKNVPHWMIIDAEAFQFIKLSDGSHNLNEILNELFTDDKLISKRKKEVENFIEKLAEYGLVNLNEKKKNEHLLERKPILENITINITKKCNLRCKHCFIRDYKSNDILNIKTFKKFVNNVKEKQLISKKLNIAILGGEPLLKKQKVLEIAKFGHKMGFKVILSTNGLLIDTKFAKKAKEHELEVQISLEGASKKINDNIRGKGTFDKIVESLTILVHYNVYTIISMVVHKDNFEDIENLYLFGQKIGINEVRFIPVKIMGQAKENITPIKRTELLYAIHNIVKKYPSAKKYLRRDYYTLMKKTCANCSKTLYCGTGLKTILIDTDGEVYPCPNHVWPEFKCGNIHNNSFDEILLDSPVLQNIREIYNVNKINDECSNCIVKYWCSGGCRGEAYEEFNSLTSKAVDCENIRESILETFWILSGEDYSNLSKQREYF